jgi:hypothetical protein
MLQAKPTRIPFAGGEDVTVVLFRYSLGAHPSSHSATNILPPRNPSEVVKELAGKQEASRQGAKPQSAVKKLKDLRFAFLRALAPLREAVIFSHRLSFGNDCRVAPVLRAGLAFAGTPG